MKHTPLEFTLVAFIMTGIGTDASVACCSYCVLQAGKRPVADQQTGDLYVLLGGICCLGEHRWSHDSVRSLPDRIHAIWSKESCKLCMSTWRSNKQRTDQSSWQPFHFPADSSVHRSSGVYDGRFGRTEMLSLDVDGPTGVQKELRTWQAWWDVMEEG